MAGLEAALALRELGSARIATTMIAPNPEFVYRPMTAREPFGYAKARRYPLDELAQASAWSCGSIQDIEDGYGRGRARPRTVPSVIHGILLTGGKPRYLSAHVTGGHGSSSETTDAPS